MENKNLIGILAIVLGLLLLVFPLLGEIVLSTFVSIVFLLIGIYFLGISFGEFSKNKVSAILNFIFGLITLILGLFLVGNVILFDILASFYFFVFGFLYIFSGILGIFSRISVFGRASSGIFIVLGILTLILGYLTLLNPLFIAIILGIGLVIDGIALILFKGDTAIE
jgi:uncharacterized membrane protein HdeD (DUF308 family)